MDPNHSLSSTERAWVIQIGSAIGNRRKATFTALLGEPVGMAPRLYILQQLLAHTGQSRPHSRQLMAIELLNHPSFEMQEGVDGDDFMHGALSIPMLDTLPALQARGFMMRPRIIHLSLMSSHLACGRWPHPDLLAADILDSQQAKESGLPTAMFSKPSVMREDFVRKLVSLTNEENTWVSKIHDGYLGACSGGKIKDMIEGGKMHRGQVISSFAVLHTRGWLTQDGLEQSVKNNHYIEADWLVWARELMHEVVAHELQQSTPKTAVRVSPRRI